MVKSTSSFSSVYTLLHAPDPILRLFSRHLVDLPGSTWCLLNITDSSIQLTMSLTPNNSNCAFTNKVIGVGSNFYGQLAIGNRVRSHPPFIPTQFGSSSNGKASSKVDEKASKSTHSVDVNSIKDIQCGSTFSVMLDMSGQIRICGYLHGAMYQVPTLLTVPTPLPCVKIACGSKHALMLLQGISTSKFLLV